MKKRILLILVVVMALSTLVAAPASAAVSKHFTVKIYKHSSVTKSNYWLKKQVQYAMDEIQDAVADEGYNLTYRLQGPYATNDSDWRWHLTESDLPCGGEYRRAADFSVAYVTQKLGQPGNAPSGLDYAVVDTNFVYNPECVDNNTHMAVKIIVLHELLHVFIQDDGHCTDSSCSGKQTATSFGVCEDHAEDIVSEQW